jgi:ABC-2 type transport system permease protein
MGLAGWAVTVKTFKVFSRYPTNILNTVLIPLYQFLIPGLLLASTFAVGGRSVGLQSTAGTGDVAGFLFLGAFTMGFSFGIFWAVSRTLSVEMTTGTLEALWLTPTPREIFPLAASATAVGIATVMGTVMLLIGWLVFGAHYVLAIVTGLPVLAVMAVGLVGMGYLVAALVLLLKQAGFLLEILAYLLAVGSGAMFPLAILPAGIRVATIVIPTTLPLDLLRAHALGTVMLLPEGWEYAAMAVVALIWAIAGRGLFLATERRLGATGALGMY